MNNNCAVWLLFFLGWQFASDSRADQPIIGERLNVVVMVADDQRWDSLGAAGNPVIRTPHLDQLARSGIHFRQAFVTTSICMTSRASILTGQYMSRHGIDQFGKPLSSEQWSNTYAGQLRTAGYYGGFVGKFGVGSVRNEDFDFSRVYGSKHWIERDGERVHVTEQNARDAIQFLNERPTDRPFVLSVSFFAPHAEDGAPEQYLPQPWSESAYTDASIPHSKLMEPNYLEALPPFLRDERNEGRVRFHWRFDTPERFQTSMVNYFRLITEVDDAVGRIIKTLKEQGVYERTLIIYIGDNGYFQADRGLADKWYPYEESIRVPLLIHDPRLNVEQRGMTVDSMALNIDLASTILAAAGMEPPDTMQGCNLAPLYLHDASKPTQEASGAIDWRDEFFYEHPTITSRERIPASQAIIRRDFKYIQWPEWNHEQLFDLTADPTEIQNLVGDSNYQNQLEHFRKQLAKWSQRVR
jgi:arylsulfatase A-like enzyme